MDGGIAEIERQQGWSCKKRMVLQKNQGPGPAEKMCPAKVKFWRMWPVAAGGQCPLPASDTQLSSFHGHPINFSKSPLCISNITLNLVPNSIQSSNPQSFRYCIFTKYLSVQC